MNKFPRHKLALLVINLLLLTFLSTTLNATTISDCKDEADLIEKTLKLVERRGKQPALQKLVNSYSQKVKTASANKADKLLEEGQRLRRKVILSHPKLNFKKLLINKRPPPGFSHNVDQYLGRHSGEGDGLVVINNWKTNPKATPILKNRLPKGSTLHPELSYDGSKVLFSFCDHTKEKNLRQFFIYEAAVDGSKVRQITGATNDKFERWGDRMTVLIEDFDPCYLPDGGMVFTSTRCQSFGRCHSGRYTPSYLLYRGELDGSGIRIISFGEANELDPTVLEDGNIGYTRWEYINRHDTWFHSLWTTRPDGTNTRILYGNYTKSPYMCAETKAIPGSTKIMTTATAHHAYTAGSIIEIDQRKGTEGTAPIRRLTPEVCFPESEGWPDSAYATPYPIENNIFFAAYSPYKLTGQGSVQGKNSFGISLVYHIDGKAYREEIYRDPEISCFSPIPIRPRKRPPVIPSQLKASRKNSKYGIYMIQDVYQSTQPIQKGTVRYIRVNEILNQPSAKVPHRSVAMHEITKKILGTVTVAPDGSCSFRAPAGVPLQLQALDKNGMALLTMRSFIYLQAGEVTSCVGCHENRSKAPASTGRRSFAKIQNIRPPEGPKHSDGFSYVKTVQPVFDRYCIGCHGLGKYKRKPNLFSLTGTPKKIGNGMIANESYYNLISQPGLIKLAQRNQETLFSIPGDYFASGGELAKMLLKGHNGIKIDKSSMWRIIDWLDVNVQFYGNYSFNREEYRTPDFRAEKELRRYIAQCFGKKLAKEPFATLVNHAQETESRILKAPMPTKYGGWGQMKGWTSPKDPRYKKMLGLIKKCLGDTQFKDVNGTCGQTRCKCGSCWVRKYMIDTGIAK